MSSDWPPAEGGVPAAPGHVEAATPPTSTYPTPGEYPAAYPAPRDYPPAPVPASPGYAGLVPVGPGYADPVPAGPRHANPGPAGPTYSGPAQPWSPPRPGDNASWTGYEGYGSQVPVGAPPQWSTAPPPPLSGRPVAPPPSGRGWLVALVSVSAVVLFGLVVMVVLPPGAGLTVPGLRPSATPAAPSASAKPTRTPSPTPTTRMPTDQKVLLKNNPIYALKVPANCPDQGRPSSATAFRAQVKALMNCENTAWKKALAATPVEFAKPKVQFYGSQTRSACGTLGSSFPAAYCSADKTMYFSTASYQQGRYYRLAVAQFVMHEYAHHVQQLADITPSSVAMRESDALTSRRIELQAHCMAHYQLTHSNLGFDSLDRADAEYQFGYTNDPKGHGSIKAERYWGRRGLNGTTIGDCNTWKVKAAQVT